MALITPGHAKSSKVIVCLLFLGLYIAVRAEEIPGPPPYKPDPRKPPLVNLVEWKVSWLEAKIKARKTAISSKTRALEADPNMDRATKEKEIAELQKANEQDQDEIGALTAKTAFDPTNPGVNERVKILKENVQAGIDHFQKLAAREIEESRDKKKTKAEREKAGKQSKEHASTETALDRDLAKAAKDNPEIFK